MIEINFWLFTALLVLSGVVGSMLADWRLRRKLSPVTYTFEQHIHAPHSLDTSQIYRQTKRLLEGEKDI